MDPDTSDDEIKDVVLDDERERHWRMVFQDNNEGWVKRPTGDRKSVV